MKAMSLPRLMDRTVAPVALSLKKTKKKRESTNRYRYITRCDCDFS